MWKDTFRFCNVLALWLQKKLMWCETYESHTGNWHGLCLSHIGTALSQLGPRSGVIYSWLFKYTQQHTAGFTENSNYFHIVWVLAPPNTGPRPCNTCRIVWGCIIPNKQFAPSCKCRKWCIAFGFTGLYFSNWVHPRILVGFVLLDL